MTALRTSVLGDTGADVTKLGFGAMELRADMGEDAAARLLNAVLDAGITMIDTSPDYGGSEELIGEFISHRRSEFFLASKCGCPVNPPPGERPPHVFTRENVRAGVEQSLRRMKTDHLDLVQFHISPSRAELEAERLGRRAGRAAGRGQDALHRHVGHAAEPHRPHRHGRVRRLPDPLLGPRARARGG